MRVIAWPAFKTKLNNPYNWLLYKSLSDMGVNVSEYSVLKILLSNYEIFHIHWPDYQLASKKLSIAVFRVAYLFFILTIAKLKNIKVIWTVHNIYSHERNHVRLERLFWNMLPGFLDGYICLSEGGKQAVESVHTALRKLPGFVVPHGHYRDVYSNSISKDSARKRLNIDPNVVVLLFIGAIRPYKNICNLIEIFNSIDDENLVLLVAGKSYDEDLLSKIRKLSSGNSRIILKLEYINEDDVQVYMNSSDLVVLPYSDILNSGSAILALSFNRPILVPNKGAINDLKTLLGPDWVNVYDGEFSSQVLKQSISKSAFVQGCQTNLDELSWNRIAENTAAVYRSVLSVGKRS